MEHGDLPIKRANGFDPNAYKLLAKAGFGQQGSASSTKGQEGSQQNGNLSN